MDTTFVIFLSLFGLLFSGVGLWFFGVAVRNIFLGFISRKWHPAVGKIVSSKVKIESGGDASQSGEIVWSGSYRYSPEVVYEYTANNARRSASKVFFSETDSRNLQSNQTIVQRYAAGSMITVYYDPARPDRAVLEPGVKPGNITTMIVAGAFALLGVGIVLAAIFGFERAIGFVGTLAFFRVVTSLGLIGGTAVLIVGLFAARRASASRRWPMTKGVVVSSKILRERSTSSSTQARRVADDYLYKPEIAFEYTVLGTKYLSNKVSVADYSSNSTSRAEQVAARYPEGKTVDVFYDPDNPQYAVLEQRAGFGVWLLFAAGLFLLAVTSLFLYIGPERFIK